MRSVTRSTIAAILLAVPSTADAAQETRGLDRRSGASALSVFDPTPTVDGLRISLVEDAVERIDVVPWDGVARLESPPGGALERRIADGIEIGTLVWRGRERLRRGDALLAAEAFTEAEARLRPAGLHGGLLDRSIVEGRLRAEAALGRADRVLGEAIVAGEYLGRPGGRFDGVAFGPEVVDPRTRLVPTVPPVGDADAIARCDVFLAAHPGVDDRTSRRRALWSRLLRVDGGPVDVERPSAEDPGAMLLWNLARLDDPDADARDAARSVLLRPDGDRPAWVAAWSRFFAGRAAIVHAADDEDRLRGVLDLLHVVADEGATSPALRRRAVDLVARTLEHLDRGPEAAVFESLDPRRPSGRRPSEPSS